MLFMVIEQFKNGDPRPVEERFRRQGRMMPEQVIYHASWIDPKQARCFQIMESEERSLLDMWISRWSDLVDFEVIPVVASQQYWASLA